jgi:hypothetical protein
MTDLAGLSELRVWVAWQGEPAAGGKVTKVPYYVNGRLMHASSTDAGTWGTREEASRWHASLPKPCPGMHGTGVVLTGIGDDLHACGIDLDTCVEGAAIEDWAHEVVVRFGSYTQLSPSGTGAKIFFTMRSADRGAVLAEIRAGAGDEEKEGTKWARGRGEHPPAIELFMGKRYFAVTGRTVEGTPAEMRCVGLSDVLWLVRQAGPAFLRGWANGADGQRDSTRSARAFRRALEFARETAGDYDDVRGDLLACLRQDDEVARWVDEKGLKHRERELKKIWQKTSLDGGWERRENGAILADSQKNARRALSEMGVRLRFDEFAGRTTAIGGGKERHFDDAYGNDLRFSIDARFGFRPSKEFFFDLCGVIARENAFHPVRDYLDGLAWDGVERINKWLVTHCGAEDTEFVRAVGRLSLVAAARRIHEPGSVFDELLVLIDQTQGTGKSSALRALCPNRRWFTDDLPFGKPAKEIIEATVGKWIIEIAELSGMRRAEIEHIKSFLSRQAENARLAYGRLATEVLRQWIPFGTTNQPVFLKDTQNRRYWPVVTGSIDTVGIERDRDQIWAEAVRAHRAGETIRLDPKLWEIAAKAQEAHREVDLWVFEIDRLVGGHSDCHITTAHLFDLLQLPNSQKNSGMSARMAGVMRELGWDNNGGKPTNIDGRPQRAWRKGKEWQNTRLLARWSDDVKRFSLVVVMGADPPF